MRTIDLSPFRRSSVGFDRMLELLDDDFSFDEADYPPYNIIRTGENSFRISLAVPGYKPDQLEYRRASERADRLLQSGQPAEADYVHRGIKDGPFERRFNLADYVQVKNAGLPTACCKSILSARSLKPSNPGGSRSMRRRPRRTT